MLCRFIDIRINGIFKNQSILHFELNFFEKGTMVLFRYRIKLSFSLNVSFGAQLRIN